MYVNGGWQNIKNTIQYQSSLLIQVYLKKKKN